MLARTQSAGFETLLINFIFCNLVIRIWFEHRLPKHMGLLSLPLPTSLPKLCLFESRQGTVHFNNLCFIMKIN
jgi:hypothetical protein